MALHPVSRTQRACQPISPAGAGVQGVEGDRAAAQVDVFEQREFVARKMRLEETTINYLVVDIIVRSVVLTDLYLNAMTLSKLFCERHVGVMLFLSWLRQQRNEVLYRRVVRVQTRRCRHLYLCLSCTTP